MSISLKLVDLHPTIAVVFAHLEVLFAEPPTGVQKSTNTIGQAIDHVALVEHALPVLRAARGLPPFHP